MVYVWSLDGSLWELVFSFCHVGLDLVLRLGSRHPYLLSHLSLWLWPCDPGKFSNLWESPHFRTVDGPRRTVSYVSKVLCFLPGVTSVTPSPCLDLWVWCRVGRYPVWGGSGEGKAGQWMALAQEAPCCVCLATDTQLQAVLLQSPEKQSLGWQICERSPEGQHSHSSERLQSLS